MNYALFKKHKTLHTLYTPCVVHFEMLSHQRFDFWCPFWIKLREQISEVQVAVLEVNVSEKMGSIFPKASWHDLAAELSKHTRCKLQHLQTDYSYLPVLCFPDFMYLIPEDLHVFVCK